MKIDLSKISQEELDAIIKEEALKIRAAMLAEQKKKAKIAHLNEMKKTLEKELSNLNLDEGLLGKMFGGGGGDAKRKQAVLNLLKHPNKGPVLLQYADDSQLAQFKQYMNGDKDNWIEWAIKRFLNNKRTPDANRADSYINFFANGGDKPRWDAATHQYVDAAQMAAGAANAFSEEIKP